MEQLSTPWLALVALTLLLGAKHGFEADHLATIDGLTRHNLARSPRLARWCGALFSAGHGAVVIAIALGLSAAADRWEVPAWAETLGAGLSIGFLLLLGSANLLAVLRADPADVVRTVGLRSRWFAAVQRTSHPALVALVGALFALSFDTMSQAALFGLLGAQRGGWPAALTLGLAFTLGMVLTDALNGWWIAGLLRRADRRARIASRMMGLTVAGLAFAVAGFGLARLQFDGIAAWSEGKETPLGLACVAVVALGALAAGRLARPAPAARHA